MILLLAQTRDAVRLGTFKAAIDGFDIRGGDQQGAGQRSVDTRAARSSPTPTSATCRSPTTSIEAQQRRLRHGPPRHARPAGARHQPAQRQRAHRQQPHHRQRRHQPGGRHRPLRRRGQLRGRQPTTSAATSRRSTAAALTVTTGLQPERARSIDNRIYFNRSYDEGGGIIDRRGAAGRSDDAVAWLRPGRHLQQPDPGQPGQRRRRRPSLPDGGQLPDQRLQQHDREQRVHPRRRRRRASNDAPNVRFYNNTVMKNITTATAVTSNGLPAPAGLSTSANSDLLQATLPAGSPTVQQPAAVQQHLLGQPGRALAASAPSPASA